MRAAALVQQPFFALKSDKTFAKNLCEHIIITKYLWGLVKFHTDSIVCELFEIKEPIG